MPPLTALLLFYLPLVVAGGAILYHLAVLVAALRFAQQKEAVHAAFTPTVSVLKPLSGVERDFYASLRSFFQQDYPSFEIICGLTDEHDPARWTVEQLQREFPAVPVQVVIAAERLGVKPLGANPLGANPKMGKLQHMATAASHEVLVISDADIRVPPDYLRRVVGPLADERVGLVTCLYRGVPASGLLSKLEALGMSADFAGQVLLARALGEVRFGLGATLATRVRQLAAIGGLAAWADYLADDFILGNRIAAAGFRVHLSHTVVETMLPPRTLREFLQQQLRWARTIRACSPWGYPGLLFAAGTPLAVLPLAYSPDSAVALLALLGAFSARFLSAAATASRVCHDQAFSRQFWLLPVRDLQALLVWVAGFCGRDIVWRKARFQLESGGRIRLLGDK